MQSRSKIVLAVGGAVALVAGAVGAATGSGSPSTTLTVSMADPTPSSTSTAYPGTVATSVSIEGEASVREDKRQTLTVEVQVAGNAKPQGQLTVAILRRGGGWADSYSVAYTGEPVSIKTSQMTKTGTYDVTASFDAPQDSVFQDSTGDFTFEVVAKPKKDDDGGGKGDGKGGGKGGGGKSGGGKSGGGKSGGGKSGG